MNGYSTVKQCSASVCLDQPCWTTLDSCFHSSLTCSPSETSETPQIFCPFPGIPWNWGIDRLSHVPPPQQLLLRDAGEGWWRANDLRVQFVGQGVCQGATWFSRSVSTWCSLLERCILVCKIHDSWYDVIKRFYCVMFWKAELGTLNWNAHVI